MVGGVHKLKLIHKGFSVIEVVIASSMLIILAIGLTSAYLLFQKSYLFNGNQNRALMIAEETLEAVRNIADNDFNLVLQGTYGLTTNNGSWNFYGSSDIVGQYTRSVTISNFEGDDNVKKVVARVYWQKNNLTTSTVELITVITNWQRPFSAGGCIIFNTTTACLSPSSTYRELTNISLSNACNFDVNAIGVEINWNSASLVEHFVVSSTALWENNCNWNCSPASSTPSTAQLSFGNNSLVIPSHGTSIVNSTKWDSNMFGISINSFKLLFDDSSFAELNNYNPPVCGALVDFVAPSPVQNLFVFSVSDSSATLRWNAPGDDNNTGTANSYDLRYSTSTITDLNWDGAIQVLGEPAPQLAGSLESMTVAGLSAGTQYYFALKSSDDNLNISSISNVAVSSTLPSVDVTPPAAVLDLITTSRNHNSVNLTWTAPGDDNNIGTATSYDIRYSTSTITDLNWSQAIQALGEPTPLIAGSIQNFTITGLSNQTTYYFAMKTSDEIPNISNLSNIAVTTTLDAISPSAISDLIVSTTTTSTATLTWTAPGDDNNIGTATGYDIRYSTTTITDLNWSGLTQVIGEVAPAVAGTPQTFIVTGLSPNTAYYFAIKTSDEVPNISALSNIASVLTLPIPQSSYLRVTYEELELTNSNRDVVGLELDNISTSTSITIAQMIVSWTGVSATRRLTQVVIEGSTLWSGSNSSGQVANITDNILTPGDNDKITRLRFNQPVNNINIQIIFVLIDGSTKTVSNIMPI